MNLFFKGNNLYSLTKLNKNKTMKKVSLYPLILLFSALFSLSSLAEKKPNIILILADDHSREAMSCYNPKSIVPTPHIDRIAREGMRFTMCFGIDSLCAPSRAAMISGRYPLYNGFKRIGDRFDGSQPTFPALLQKAGYETVLFGKWHLKSTPTGFNHWEIIKDQGRYRNPILFSEKGKKKYKGHLTEIITDRAINWLKNRHSNKPFCLLLHHKAPHTPHHAPPAYAKRFENLKIPEPSTFNDNFSGRFHLKNSIGHFSKFSHITPAHFNKKVPKGLSGAAYKSWGYQTFFRGYFSLVAHLDDEVGRFLTYLDKSGLSKNTVVIYTSDNGFFLGDHGMFNKMWMYEPSLSLPLLVRWPGTVKPNTVDTSHIVSILDLGPTFLEIAGAPPHKEFQGFSWIPLLKQKNPTNWRKALYYRYYNQFEVPSHDGIRTARYKLIRFEQGKKKTDWEFFDLKKDPNELHNLIGKGDKNEIRLRNILLKIPTKNPNKQK